VAKACRYLGWSRQAYYQDRQRQRARATHEAAVVRQVQAIRLRQPRLGTRKLHHLLRERWAAQGTRMGRDALFGVLGRARLLVPPRRAYHKTTHSHHRFRRHPNLLKPGPLQVTIERPEQVWVADITYLPTHQQCVYLSLVTDAYSRKIVGWHVHDTLQAEGVRKALEMALRGRQSTLPLIHHSDRGIQYCAEPYQQLHRQHGIRCSMTDGYDCYQNALAERVNGILKGELLLQRPCDLQQARRMVKESVAIYNHERPHLSLQYRTPDEVHRAFLSS
jgi:putative transposase